MIGLAVKIDSDQIRDDFRIINFLWADNHNAQNIQIKHWKIIAPVWLC